MHYKKGKDQVGKQAAIFQVLNKLFVILLFNLLQIFVLFFLFKYQGHFTGNGILFGHIVCLFPCRYVTDYAKLRKPRS